MKTEIPCAVVRDLLPSFIDELTSEETNEIIKEHIDSCDNCRRTLDSMRSPETAAVDEKQKKEIDFLKKNRSRNKKVIFACVFAALGLLTVWLFLRFFVIGGYENADMVVCRVSVDGNRVSVTGAVKQAGFGISDVSFEEKDSSVTMKIRTVPFSWFYEPDFTGEYVAEENVLSVAYNGTYLWKDSDVLYSERMTDELLADWDAWNALSKKEKKATIRLPGHFSEILYGWKAFEEDVGRTVFIPFEVYDKNVTDNIFSSEGLELSQIAGGNINFNWSGEESGRITSAVASRTYWFYTSRYSSRYGYGWNIAADVDKSEYVVGTTVGDHVSETGMHNLIVTLYAYVGDEPNLMHTSEQEVTAYSRNGLVIFMGIETVDGVQICRLTYTVGDVNYTVDVRYTVPDKASNRNLSFIGDILIRMIASEYKSRGL